MLELEAQGSGKVLVIGHRGALGHAPENTTASFAKGLECGADLIELDVHLTADDAIVVLHDDDVSRTTDGRGAVRGVAAHRYASGVITGAQPGGCGRLPPGWALQDPADWLEALAARYLPRSWAPRCVLRRIAD